MFSGSDRFIAGFQRRAIPQNVVEICAKFLQPQAPAHQLRRFPQLPRFHLKPLRLAILHWLIEKRLIMQGATNGIGCRFFRILGRGNRNKFRVGYFVRPLKILLLFPNDV
jgi:hypothetical protein